MVTLLFAYRQILSLGLTGTVGLTVLKRLQYIFFVIRSHGNNVIRELQVGISLPFKGALPETLTKLYLPFER